MNILIYTLGCPKNFNDSQVAAGILEEAGHTVIMANDDISDKVDFDLESDEMQQIDAIMVNTCGFIRDAKTESIEAIFAMSAYGKLLIISGCLSQRYGEELYKEMPEVDLFIGVNEYDRLPALLEAYEGKRAMYVRPYTEELESPSRKLADEHYAATIKISEGCNNACTFCAIPGIRGPYRSRPKEKILEEARHLADEGVKEIILIAQDTTEYGRDLYGEPQLAKLLRTLCTVEGVHWIRTLYSYPTYFSDELIETIASEPKLVKYVDLPMQHAHDEVLRRMHRPDTQASMRALIEKLRTRIPGVTIRSTFIVGFPGETDAQYQTLRNFLEEMRLDKVGVFTYSREEGTPAYDMPNQVPEDVMQERYHDLMSLQCKISEEINQSLEGKELDVLVEGRDEEQPNIAVGRSYREAPDVDGQVYIENDTTSKPGDIVRVKVLQGFTYDLVGEPLQAEGKEEEAK